jgi:FMN-dependent NADH-azoreductase
LALKEALRLSDQLTDELLASDTVVIATPMWNFAIPSSLKAWMDLIVRSGKTFNYAGSGVIGLAKDKKAILVLASRRRVHGRRMGVVGFRGAVSAKNSRLHRN